jgi:hypothetical protein
MKKVSVVLLGLILVCGPAYGQSKGDGPFGVDMGSDIKILKTCKSLDQKGMYACESLPKKHSEFESYILQFHESVGICWVKGIGKNVQTNGHGTSLKSKFDEIKEQLDSVYGMSKSDNLLMPGSIWKDSEDFTMSIKQKDRIYSATWENGKMKANIKSVYLSISVLNATNGYVIVEFAFNNEAMCDSAIKADNAKSF